MKQKDLPAFPITVTPDTSIELFGVTIRDYFAAKAMQILLQEAIINKVKLDSVWTDAYWCADRMLDEREK